MPESIEYSLQFKIVLHFIATQINRRQRSGELFYLNSDHKKSHNFQLKKRGLRWLQPERSVVLHSVLGSLEFKLKAHKIKLPIFFLPWAVDSAAQRLYWTVVQETLVRINTACVHLPNQLGGLQDSFVYLLLSSLESSAKDFFFFTSFIFSFSISVLVLSGYLWKQRVTWLGHA